MGRCTGGNQQQFFKLQGADGILRPTDMTHVRWVKGTAVKSDSLQILRPLLISRNFVVAFLFPVRWPYQ